MQFDSENWQSGEENRKRGRAWLNQIYKANHKSTENTLAAHQDFSWLSIEITYGLYLSDHSILNGVETELVVLSGIMIQNLPRETGWHLRGTRRMGIWLVRTQGCAEEKEVLEWIKWEGRERGLAVSATDSPRGPEAAVPDPSLVSGIG